MIAFIHGDVLYDLDHLRHFMAWGFNPNNWFTNGTEQIIALAIGALLARWLIPKFTRRMHAFVDKKLDAHRKAIHEDHKVLLAEHRTLIDKDHRAALADHRKAVSATTRRAAKPK